MIVFKTYLKILWRNIGLVLLYIGISVLMVTLNSATSTQSEGYVEDKINLAVIDRDNSEFSRDLRSYLESRTNPFEVEDNEHAIQDFIYDNYTRAIVIIPEGFEEAALRGEAEVEQKFSMDGVGTLSELYASSYLSNLNAMARGGLERGQILKQLKNRENIETEVTIEKTIEEKDSAAVLAQFTEFSAYPIMSAMIVVVGTVACVFNAEMIKRRNEISAFPTSKLSAQLAIGNIGFSVVLVLVLWVVGAIMAPDSAFSAMGAMMLVSMLALALVFGAFGMLITSFVQKREVISGMQTVIPLALSFISGIFFPVELLAEGMVALAKCFPAYWFAQGIERILDYTEFGWTQWREVLLTCLAILAFGVGYYLLSVLVKVAKRVRNRN